MLSKLARKYLFAGIAFAALPAHAAQILYFLAPTGGGSSLPSGAVAYRYTYQVSGLLSPNQELAFEFDPNLFGSLWNGSASADFDVKLFQPNNPPGTAGYFTALLKEGSPATTSATFGVDCAYLGPGAPGVQNFVINEFDATGNFLKVIASGATIESGVPEPSYLAPGGLGLLIAGGLRAIRRRRPETAA